MRDETTSVTLRIQWRDCGERMRGSQDSWLWTAGHPKKSLTSEAFFEGDRVWRQSRKLLCHSNGFFHPFICTFLRDKLFSSSRYIFMIEDVIERCFLPCSLCATTTGFLTIDDHRWSIFVPKREFINEGPQSSSSDYGLSILRERHTRISEDEFDKKDTDSQRESPKDSIGKEFGFPFDSKNRQERERERETVKTEPKRRA